VEADGTAPDTTGPPKPDTVGEMCNTDGDCDDGLFCNGEETCMPDHIDSDATGCLDGIPPKSTDDNPIDCRTVLECDEDIDDFPIVNLQGGETCDDGIACTTSDTCDSFGNCQGTPTDSQCDDGLFCNGAETCAFHIGCRAGTPPSPGANADPDPTDCLVPSTCVEATQSFDMAPATAGTLCNDGVDCTFEDACTGAGTCGGVPNDGFCDDGNSGTIDQCDAQAGCSSTDIDECATNTDNCNDNATCTNTEGSFDCACNEYWQGDGTTCTDIDECDPSYWSKEEPELHLQICGEGAPGDDWWPYWICTNNEGAAPTCEDLKECDTNNGNVGPPEHVQCIEVVGAYPGQSDINECDNGTHLCDANATCTNTVYSAVESPNGHTCTCNAGFTGDGTSCTAILCGANEYVSSNACVACPAGETNDAGDDASGADTTCDP